ncbi:hypothetical protein AOX55_00004716 (plasmid) [Sinorhizobium fredii CCBAU 25509]|nr:hypothetical protein AOX55_00004716 [Sinorhizobium fredii CCBAU 25509]
MARGMANPFPPAVRAERRLEEALNEGWSFAVQYAGAGQLR